MASIGFLIGGALINALDFSGSNFLFSSLSKESIDKERKRHNKAVEDFGVIFCSVAYLRNQLIRNERDTIKQLKICNNLKQNGLKRDKNDWITLITK